MSLNRTKRRSDFRVFVALLLLFTGIGLLDRGFARWRNDPRNFPNALGHYLTTTEVDPDLRSQMSNQKVVRAMMVAGFGFVSLSVVLFGIEPIGGRRQ